MCGIVGLFIKNPTLEPQLGNLLSDMLIEMSERGPDSAQSYAAHLSEWELQNTLDV
jgi:glutamate synthase domain-containing protein 1